MNEQVFSFGNEVLSGRFVPRKYVVMFLDLMAQKKFFSDLRDVGVDSEIGRARIYRLSDALYRFNAGVLQAVHDIQTRALAAVRGLVDENVFRQFEKWIASLNIGVQQFSDTTLLYVNASNPASILVVKDWLQLIAMRMLSDMSSEFVLRGGVAYGDGWEISENCLYGPVMQQVYELESKVANWGRIVFSCGMVQWMERVAGLAGKIGGNRGVGDIELARCLVSEDLDGVPFLDYLGCSAVECFKRQGLGSDWFCKTVDEGLRFLRNQICDLRKKEDGESIKLACRYEVMCKYWMSRFDQLRKCYEEKEKYK